MIFLSYAKEDGDRAAKIFSVLSKPSRQVFYDKDALMPGMDWRYEIEEKVNKSSLVVILLSRNSVSKEGFVQREIRLALDRAEMMPDGRIFIIPVRLDDVQVPGKLSNYQWLDMPADEDIFDLEFAIEYAEARLLGARSPDEPDPVDAALDKSLLRERVVILLQGKNIYGDHIFTYLKLALWKLQRLRNAMRRAEDFMPADYGQVLAAGKGEPSAEMREAMAQEHNMIDIPRGDHAEEDAKDRAEAEWLHGYEEAFRSIAGVDVVPPAVERPIVMADRGSALREGIQHGLNAARQRLQSHA